MMILAGCVFMLAIGVGCMAFLFDMRLRSLERPPHPEDLFDPRNAAKPHTFEMARASEAMKEEPLVKPKRTSMANLRANLAAERTEKQAKEERVGEFRG